MKLQLSKTIKHTKDKIKKLTEEQDRLFDELCIVLGIDGKPDGEKGWMFDYIFNDSSEDTYEEYLKRFRQ